MTDVREGRFTLRWQHASVIVALGGAIVGFFLVLSASRVDLVSLFGLDFLFGPKDVFSPRENNAFKILVNLVASVGLAAAFYVFRERAKRREELESNGGARSFQITGNSNVVHVGQPQNKSEGNEITNSRDAAITSLNKRISALSLRATTIYWTMILALITGVILIIFAGYLSSFDTTFASLSTKIESDRQEAANSYFRLLERRSDRLSAGAPISSLDLSSLEYASARLKAIDESYLELTKAMIKQTSERADSKPVWNWPSTILRVGVIGLLVFLTYILIDLYRYNSRLIAFYGSRRDALLLCEVELTNLEAFSKLMFPVNLDFGKEPRHPFQEISELIRHTGKKIKDKTKRNVNNATISSTTQPTATRDNSTSSKANPTSVVPTGAA